MPIKSNPTIVKQSKKKTTKVPKNIEDKKENNKITKLDDYEDDIDDSQMGGEESDNKNSDNESESEDNYEVEGNIDDIEDVIIDDDNLDDGDGEIIDEDNGANYKNIDSDNDDCIYDDDGEVGIDDDEIKGSKIVLKEERKTKAKLTYYERVSLKETRVSHLNRKAKPLVKNTEGLSTKEIAELEIKSKTNIPMKIRRTRPDGMIEIWDIEELMQDEDYEEFGIYLE